MKRVNLTATIAIAALAGAPASPMHSLRAQDAPIVTAVQRSGSIRIDGSLDEQAWQLAPPVRAFVQGEPLEGVPAHQDTEVRILYDEDALYVGARMLDQEPHRIARQLVRRDERGQFDYFEIAIDPDRDLRTGYRFRVSAAGVQSDAYLFDDDREDSSWDAVWESSVAADRQGWSVEIRIPLSQIRYEPSAQTQQWGVNFKRRRVASNEVSYLSLVSRRRRGVVSVFATLGGLTLPDAPRRLELRPYVLGRALSAPAEGGNPFFDGTEFEQQIGADVRLGVTPTFTLDATVNPDFGQVEVDPAEINLTAFETFFQERRPFFVEDARVFDFSLAGRENLLFYSRRIGRRPRRQNLDDASFIDAPTQSTIDGAAKLTGRTASGLGVGVLAAVTAAERARAYFVDGDSTVRFLAEPRSWHGVARVQQDLRNGASQVGGIVTAIRRDLPGDDSFDFLPSSAVNAGIDFEHSWQNRAWLLSGFLAGTYVEGSTEAITRIQRSAGHYFQRPDAIGFSVDSSARSLAGLEWRLELDRQSGEHWTGSVWIGERTPGFEPNDMGFLRGSERFDIGSRIAYQEITPGDLFRSYHFSLFTFHNFRHEITSDPFSARRWGHAYRDAAVFAGVDATFHNYWSLELDARLSPRVLDDARTRGGPLMVNPPSFEISGGIESDPRGWFSVGAGAERRWGDGGDSFDVGVELTLRPASWLSLQLEPWYGRSTDAAQYVTQTDDVGYAPTFGRRYLFAHLERRTVEMETRLNVTFSPTMTLQLFAQPLLSAGDYLTYRQLARAESFAFTEFAEGAALRRGDDVVCVGGSTCRDGEERHLDFDGNGASDFSFGERDFRVRSLRGNAVFRWEYRPGSAIFVVWQQSREYEDLLASRFRVFREVPDLFDVRPENVWIVKGTFWVGL